MLSNWMYPSVSKQQTVSMESIPADAEIAPELIEALVQKKLGPLDIEVRFFLS